MKHEIAELLPFYANGTLDAAEHARVEAELATCATCAEELHELRSLGDTLRAHAEGAPPLPAHILDDAMARIAMPRTTAAATRIRSAWWGTPARYATAAAIVLSFGVAGAAAWRAHEADVASSQVALRGTVSNDRIATTIFRVTPAPNAPKTAKLAAGSAQGVPAAAGADAPAQSVEKRHRLAKSAKLELLVRDVEASLKAARSAVRAAGGDVTALADASPRDSGAVHSAQLDVEVPADRLDGTLDTLAALGAVQNRRIDAEDVDAAIVDEEARLRNLRRAETDLRKLMDKGGKVDEILTVQQNLSEVRGQIEQLDAQHQHDVHRVATSTISVELTEDRPNAAPAKPGPSARIDGAWHAGLSALADSVVAIVSSVAWCLAYSPVPLVLGAAVFGVLRAVLALRARFTPA